MNSRLLLGILVVLALQTQVRAQTVPLAAEAGRSKTPVFSAQKTVVYLARNGATVSQETMRWYTDFFDTEPDESKLDGENRYIIYSIGGIRVCVGVDPNHLDTSLPLERTVFYWVLPEAKDVEAKFEALKKQDNKFVGFLTKLRRIAKRNEDETRAAAPEAAVQEVKAFIVRDPLGNEIGVINNPIYVPTR